MFNLFSSYHGLVTQAKKELEAGDFDSAYNTLKKAVQKDPNHPRAFSWLGYLYLKAQSEYFLEGDREKARESCELGVKAFDEAIRRETDLELKTDFYWKKAALLRLLGRAAESETTLNEADRCVPGYSSRRTAENLQALEDAVKSIAKQRGEKTE